MENRSIIVVVSAVVAILSIVAVCYFLPPLSALPDDLWSLNKLGLEAMNKRDWERMDMIYTKAASGATRIDDHGWKAIALEYLAIAKLHEGAETEAAFCAEEACREWRLSGKPKAYTCIGESTAARFYVQAHDDEKARKHAENAATLLREIPQTDENYPEAAMRLREVRSQLGLGQER